MGDGFRYIRQAAQRLRDEFDSDVPRTVDELCSLPGVGPKMAFLCLHAAWDMCVVPSHPFFSAALLMGD
jgi:endonuclease-3